MPVSAGGESSPASCLYAAWPAPFHLAQDKLSIVYITVIMQDGWWSLVPGVVVSQEPDRCRNLEASSIFRDIYCPGQQTLIMKHYFPRIKLRIEASNHLRPLPVSQVKPDMMNPVNSFEDSKLF